LHAYYSYFNLQSAEDLTADELVSILVDAEWEWRQHCKMQRYIKQAGFRSQAAVEEIDFHANRNLNKNQVADSLYPCS